MIMAYIHQIYQLVEVYQEIQMHLLFSCRWNLCFLEYLHNLSLHYHTQH